MSKPIIDHIGDGVYVEFNGYGLDIRVNDHRNPVAVSMDPYVLKALDRFRARVKAETGVEL